MQWVDSWTLSLGWGRQHCRVYVSTFASFCVAFLPGAFSLMRGKEEMSVAGQVVLQEQMSGTVVWARSLGPVLAILLCTEQSR